MRRELPFDRHWTQYLIPTGCQTQPVANDINGPIWRVAMASDILTRNVRYEGLVPVGFGVKDQKPFPLQSRWTKCAGSYVEP